MTKEYDGKKRKPISFNIFSDFEELYNPAFQSQKSIDSLVY